MLCFKISPEHLKETTIPFGTIFPKTTTVVRPDAGFDSRTQWKFEPFALNAMENHLAFRVR